MTADTSVARVLKIAATCYNSGDEIVSVMDFLEAGNTEEVTTALSTRTDLGYCLNLVQTAMFERLLMSVMRMHDGPGPDRQSLPSAFDLLTDSATLEALQQRGSAARLASAVGRWAELQKKYRARNACPQSPQ